MVNKKIIKDNINEIVNGHGYIASNLYVYYFKKMVFDVVTRLENVCSDDYGLLERDIVYDLKNDYFDVYRFVNKALEKTVASETNYELMEQVYGDLSRDMDCFNRAFVLGSFVSSGMIQDKKVKTRFLSLRKYKL